MLGVSSPQSTVESLAGDFLTMIPPWLWEKRAVFLENVSSWLSSDSCAATRLFVSRRVDCGDYFSRAMELCLLLTSFFVDVRSVFEKTVQLKHLL